MCEELYQNFRIIYLVWHLRTNCEHVQGNNKSLIKQGNKCDENYIWGCMRVVKSWSMSQFKSFLKTGKLWYNLYECFNACVTSAGEKPIIIMFERIRMYLMKRIAIKRIQTESWNNYVGPRIRQIIKKLKEQSIGLHTVHSRERKYEVSDSMLNKWVVDLIGGNCTLNMAIKWNHLYSCNYLH